MLTAFLVQTVGASFYKIQSMTYGKDLQQWRHPYWQAAVATIGELMAFLVYFIRQKCSTKSSKNNAPVSKGKKINKLMFAVPSFFHQFYNCLRLIANVMISASVVQMLSSSNMIFIALLTVFFLKKKYFRHHLLSILLIVLGMSFVSLSFVLSNDSGSSDHSTTDMVIGLIC